jgi:hypothetical protein
MDEVTIDMPEPVVETPAQEVTPPVQTETTNTSETLKAEVVESPIASVSEQPQIERNEKGQIVKGVAQDTNKNGTAGRPCEYCEDKENKQKIVDSYLKGIQESDKPAIPWVEELALLLNIDDGTLVNWANKIDDEGDGTVHEHPELFASYRRLKSVQKLRLKQRAVIGRFNPHGALYLLNADHKVIQTTKEILASDTNEPLKIVIVDEKPLHE